MNYNRFDHLLESGMSVLLADSDVLDDGRRVGHEDGHRALHVSQQGPQSLCDLKSSPGDESRDPSDQHQAPGLRNWINDGTEF